PGGATTGAKCGGSLSDLCPGGLGSVLGGAAAGSVLSGGLGNIIKELQDSGQGRVAQSWVGTGPNEDIAPKDLAHALGSDTLNTLSKQTGLSMDELLAGLSQNLPDLVDQLTPKGRLPTEEEAAGMVWAAPAEPSRNYRSPPGRSAGGAGVADVCTASSVVDLDRIGAATMPPNVTARRSSASRSAPTGMLAERYDRGVGLRQKTPRKKHADLLGPTDRDPVAILARGDRTRVPELVPVR